MPNPYGQEDAQNILDRPVVPLPKPFNASAQLGNIAGGGQWYGAGMGNPNLPTPTPTSGGWIGGGVGNPNPFGYTDTGTGGKPVGAVTPVTESARNAGVGAYNALGAGGNIPLPQASSVAPQTTLDTPMGAGMNLKPEDYSNTDFPTWLQGFMDKYGFRAEIDSRFPSGVDEETAFNYLFEKYGFMFPEMTDWLRGDDGGGEDQGYAGGYEIPLPDYSWGGGGYGGDKGYRDSGLVNWRI